MNLIKKYPVFMSTLLGTIFGYIILHPFVNIVNDFFHRHEQGHMHLHWNAIAVAFTNSFDSTYWLNAISYVILSGIIGYLFGKTISAYRTISEQVEKFSIVGMNAATIVHDLNNPLNGVIGFAHLLKNKIDNQEQIKACDIIEREAIRISKMIEDIKMFVQATETIELSKTPADLKLFLKNIIFKMTLYCKVRIDSTFEGQVLIDRDYFERVLWNLIKNADEALRLTEDGRIEISISESDNSVNICVSDNGPGIPQKILKNLFKLGQTFGKKGGTGIGLYNCKKIVEAHRGKIWLDSEVGKGTKFYIKIPK